MKQNKSRLVSLSLTLTFLLAASAPTLQAQPYPSAVLADNPTAFWRLQETSGTVAYDSAGNDNGSYTNVTLGQQGYAVGLAAEYNYTPATDTNSSAGFGGDDSYVSGMTLDFASASNIAFSAEGWVNGGPQSGGAGIVGKGWGGGEEYFIDCGAANNAFRFYVRNASGSAVNASSTNLPDGNWHHLVGVCDEINGRIYLYVDGQLAASNSATGGIKSTTNLYMTIGSRQSVQNGDFNYQFNGEIGEVAMYSYALSATQVQHHYLAAGIPPTITQEPPTSVTINEGTTLIVAAAATGTPPLSYQWNINNAPVAGQTNATFVLSNVPGSLYGGSLVLVVTNLYGSTSDNGTFLNVNSGAPAFLTNLPPQLALYQGEPITYSVTVENTAPFYYQWFQDRTSIPGATNSSYTINTLAGTNTYYVNVSNNYNGGSVSASYTSTLVGVPVPTNSYPAAIIAANPIAYWRLDEPDNGSGNNGSIAYDYAGGHDGTYSQVQLGVPGYSPEDPDTAALFGTNAGYSSGSYMQETDKSSQGIPNIDSYLQGSNVDFSVECWVNGPAGGENSGGSTIISLGNNGTDAFLIDADAPGGKFRYYYRNKAGTSGTIYSTFGPDGNWHQLVAVFDESNTGATVFYVDGNLAGTLGGLSGTGLYTPSATLSVGSDGTYQFNGTIDEVSIYNYALTVGELTAHYNAAPLPPAFEAVPPGTVAGFVGGSVTLSATVIGSTPLTNQWFSNTTALVGQTNVFLALKNLSVGTNIFTLWVTNAYGKTNTAGTSVQVAAGAGPPVFVANVTPLTNTLYATETASYSVTVSGSTPLYYQWWSNGVSVSRATNSSYIITNLTTSDAGSYYCVVSNQYSNIVSSTALLNVVPAPTNPYSLTVMADHPVSYWRLDETNGSTIGYDYVGGNNGIYSNTAGINHLSGAFGTNFDADTAAYFNTNLSYTRQITAISNYLGTTMTNVDFAVPNGQNGEFSIEAWVRGYTNYNQTSGGGIVAKGFGNGGEEFNIDAHTGLRFYCRNAAGTVTASAQAAPTLTGSATGWVMDGKWHYVVGVCDQINANLLLYVDGTLIGYPVISNGVVPFEAYQYQTNHNPANGTNGIILPGTGLYPANFNTGNAGLWGFNSVSIGARNSGTNNTGYTFGFDGAVDEVAMYNYCLTPLQVSNHYAVAMNLTTTISVQLANGHVVLSWFAIWATSTLQSAPAINGPWTTVVGATSPYTAPVSGPALFYRVKNQ